MADETITGVLGAAAEILQGGQQIADDDYIIRRINGSGSKPGMLMTEEGESAYDVAPGITTDTVYSGVLSHPAEVLTTAWDIDTVIPDNKLAKLVRLGSNKVVPMFLEATAGPVALEFGDLLAAGTEAGKVRSFIYADAAAATDSSLEIIGTFEEDADAGSTSDDHVILVRLNK